MNADATVRQLPRQRRFHEGIVLMRMAGSRLGIPESSHFVLGAVFHRSYPS
jgi:hypothetical protein